MKKLNKRIVLINCVLVGVCLLVLGTLVLISWQLNIQSSIVKSQSYVQTLRTIIPNPQGAVPEEYRDNTMPILSIDKTDFIGILEIPRYGSALPVGANWGRITKNPCKFSGSIYDRTMLIGATSQIGQYNFYREISVGDTVLFTDVEGNRYTYAVTNLQYEKHADQTTLNLAESALTLFIKNVYNFDYLIVSCNILN